MGNVGNSAEPKGEKPARREEAYSAPRGWGETRVNIACQASS